MLNQPIVDSPPTQTEPTDLPTTPLDSITPIAVPTPRQRPALLPPRPRVVIIGAGFGGLSAARALAGKDVQVLILDRNNYHGFWPLLYQVATAGLEPEAIAYPVRNIIRDMPNIGFRMTEVQGVDFTQRLVHTNTGDIPYHFLVLAAGSANNYFGNDVLAQQTFSLKDINDAELLRNQVLSAFEHAVSEQNRERHASLMTIAIIGGGPTGVELAGAFSELVRHAVHHDYPMLDINDTRVVLIEASDRILAAFPTTLQQSALSRLHKIGVEVHLQAAVASVEGQRITFADGSSMEAETVVWAAGVRGAMLTDSLNTAKGRGARVVVNPTLNLPTHPEVFVVGDMAYLEGYNGGKNAYPMIAPVAVQQGKLAARNIVATMNVKPLQSFRYFDNGAMATIGRRAAVLNAFGIRLSGFVAWLGWLFVHLMSLVGFRNRMIVLTNWTYNYFTYDRGVRLITGRKG